MSTDSTPRTDSNTEEELESRVIHGKRVTVGDRVSMTAVNGHVFDYRVVGFYEHTDGQRERYQVKTTQYDSWHSDKCKCDQWEDGDRSIPDW